MAAQPTSGSTSPSCRSPQPGTQPDPTRSCAQGPTGRQAATPPKPPHQAYGTQCLHPLIVGSGLIPEPWPRRHASLRSRGAAQGQHRKCKHANSKSRANSGETRAGYRRQRRAWPSGGIRGVSRRAAGGRTRLATAQQYFLARARGFKGSSPTSLVVPNIKTPCSLVNLSRVSAAAPIPGRRAATRPIALNTIISCQSQGSRLPPLP